jgi:hypothetical protein
MPNFIYLIVFALVGVLFGSHSGVYAQAPGSLAQLQEAVQIRIENLVRSTANNFYEKSHLPPPELSQVVAVAQFVEGQGGAEISSLDLKIQIESNDPPEVIRQLRQYIAQGLSREGFAVDQAQGDFDSSPRLALTLDVVSPQLSGIDLNIKERWPDYLRFGLIILAFLSSLFFLGYLFLLPAAWRRRRLVKLNELQRRRPQEREQALELPPLPILDFEQPSDRSTLRELHVLDDQHIQKYPVWVDPTGARMSDIEGIRKTLEVLPFEEALDMLTCMDVGEREAILSRLNLNPSVKNRIKKELEKKEAAPSLPVPNN